MVFHIQKVHSHLVWFLCVVFPSSSCLITVVLFGFFLCKFFLDNVAERIGVWAWNTSWDKKVA